MNVPKHSIPSEYIRVEDVSEICCSMKSDNIDPSYRQGYLDALRDVSMAVSVWSTEYTRDQWKVYSYITKEAIKLTIREVWNNLHEGLAPEEVVEAFNNLTNLEELEVLRDKLSVDYTEGEDIMYWELENLGYFR